MAIYYRNPSCSFMQCSHPPPPCPSLAQGSLCLNSPTDIIIGQDEEKFSPIAPLPPPTPYSSNNLFQIPPSLLPHIWSVSHSSNCPKLMSNSNAFLALSLNSKTNF